MFCFSVNLGTPPCFERCFDTIYAITWQFWKVLRVWKLPKINGIISIINLNQNYVTNWNSNQKHFFGSCNDGVFYWIICLIFCFRCYRIFIVSIILAVESSFFYWRHCRFTEGKTIYLCFEVRSEMSPPSRAFWYIQVRLFSHQFPFFPQSCHKK